MSPPTALQASVLLRILPVSCALLPSRKHSREPFLSSKRLDFSPPLTVRLFPQTNLSSSNKKSGSSIKGYLKTITLVSLSFSSVAVLLCPQPSLSRGLNFDGPFQAALPISSFQEPLPSHGMSILKAIIHGDLHGHPPATLQCSQYSPFYTFYTFPFFNILPSFFFLLSFSFGPASTFMLSRGSLDTFHFLQVTITTLLSCSSFPLQFSPSSLCDELLYKGLYSGPFL